MKIATVLTLLGAALVSGQDTKRSAPFWLKFTASPEDTGETYLYSCHSGAGEVGICPETTSSEDESESPTTHQQYFLNESTQAFETHPLGLLTWNMPIGNGSPIPSSMSLRPQLVSNGAIPIFSPGNRGTYGFGFDENEKLFLFSRQDDSKAVPERAPYTAEAYYLWHVCWTFVGNYYYKALVWVTAGEPVNPTCQAVNVHREWAPTS